MRRSPTDPTEVRARTNRRHSLAVMGCLIGAVLLASCERTPSKSDYVSAQVSARCSEERGDALRACRIAIIKEFKDTPLEEMQQRFPAPEPRTRPSCGV